MPTPFSDIYDRFLRKVSDYSLVNLTNEELDTLLADYLTSAIPKFRKCRKDLSLQTSSQFDEDLTGDEQEILATLMILEWISPRIYTIELLKQSLGSKDWQLYSQANHLKELRSLRSDIENELDRMMIDYSYSVGKVDDFR